MFRIIGIDCATKVDKTGIAMASLEGGKIRLQEARLGGSDLADVLRSWIGGSSRTLLALDAPFGRPEPLGKALSDHKAGFPIAQESNRLFRRCTDDVVYNTFKKRPLDVGADRIARTAHGAVNLLETLGSIPMA